MSDTFFTLPEITVVELLGDDRISFLHNMCTIDVKQLAEQSAGEAFLTDVKGKIVAHVLVVRLADRLQLLAVPGQGERIISHLDRYIIREDVQLIDRSSELQITLVDGEESKTLVNELQPLRAKSIELGGEECLAIVYDGFLEPCVALCHPQSADGMTAVLVERGFAKTGSEIWHAKRVRTAVPLFGVDFDESNLPQEVDRDSLAISFRKGCYLGQETIARLDALGHVNKKIVLLEINAAELPVVGTMLHAAEKEVGAITSVCREPAANKIYALAMVRRAANDVGTTLQLNGDTARVIAKPER